MVAFVPLALGAGRMAMQALPYISALYGASEGAKEGGLVGALTGGGLGYLGGRLGTGVVSKGRRMATQAAPSLTSKVLGLDPKARLKPGLANVVKATGYAAVPLAAVGLGAPLIGQLAGGATGVGKNIVQSTAGPALATGSEAVQALQGDNVTVDPYTGQVVPNMPGLPGFAEYQNPLGPYQANLGYQRDLYRLGREEQAKQLSMLEPVIERAKTREMERQMAAARYRTDLGTQSGLVLQGQRGAQAMAERGLAGGIQGLTQQYTYG